MRRLGILAPLLLLVCLRLEAAGPSLPALDVAGVNALLAPDARQGLEAAALMGEFVQTKRLAGLPQPLVSSGRFLLARGEGIEWQVLKPFESRYVLTREALTQETAGQRQQSAVAQQPGLAAASRLLLALFALDVDALDSEFRFAGARHTTGWQLVLTPRHEGLAAVFQEARLQGAAQLAEVTLRDARGDVTELRFTHQQALPTLTPDLKARFR
jgi:hypothetical protein